MKDNESLSRLKNGDKAALGEIIDRYSGYVYTVAKNFSRGAFSEDELDEIITDVFYGLWRCREKLNIKTELSAYIAGITRNIVKNRFRKRKVRIEDISELDVASEVSVERGAELAEIIGCLYEGMEGLADDEREIICRFYFYGEKSSQIAKKLGMAENTVYTKLSRTRKKLKTFLTERGFDHV